METLVIAACLAAFAAFFWLALRLAPDVRGIYWADRETAPRGATRPDPRAEGRAVERAGPAPRPSARPAVPAPRPADAAPVGAVEPAG